MNKPNQAELRRLMKEKQQQVSKQKQIDSPLAKYIDGQLTCIVCDCPIKAEPLWLAHINGKSHKQNIDALKGKAKLKPQTPAVFKRPPSPPKPIKRKATPVTDSVEEKKLKSVHIKDEPPKNSPQALRELFNTLEEKNEEIEKEESQLPSDFFDNKMEVDSDNHTPETTNTNDLPEGFFDNPIIDAKVRKVEYKDPADVEWDKFQREIADVSNKSQAIIAEEEEESTVERQIEEVDEQIANWARVDVLQRRKDELEAKMKEINMDKQSDDSSADEQDFDEFLDWRKKDAWR